MRINSEVNNPQIPLGSVPKPDGSHKISSNRASEKLNADATSYKGANIDQTVFIKSNLAAEPDGAQPLALFERNELHESGEIFCAGADIVKAALTEKVANALRRGDVVECSQSEYDEQQAEKPALEPTVADEMRGLLH
jgi:hypothetical protein